jgi:RNA polymerase sigma-70 factor, ECF subfamily
VKSRLTTQFYESPGAISSATELTQESDASLVAASKRGDSRAFDELVNRHSPKMFRTALRITRNIQDAEDAMQESLQKAFVHLRTFEEKASFPTWLTRITINEALCCLRRERARNMVLLDEATSEQESRLLLEIPDTGETPEEIYSQLERQEMLSVAMKQLRPGLQRALKLQFEHRTNEETAKIMRVGIATVKARLFRGRKQVRRLLKRHARSTRKSLSNRLQEAA